MKYSITKKITMIMISIVAGTVLVTPAPTAASVIARSGDCKQTQITDITRL